MRIRFGVCVIALAFSSMLSAQSRSPAELQHLWAADIELITDCPERNSQALLEAIQKLRPFFDRIGLQPANHLPPIQIRAVQEAPAVPESGLQRGAFGHYRHDQGGDFIVLTDLDPQHRQAALHEYVHAVFRRAGYRLPVWLSEGLADIYSTLSTPSGILTVGETLPLRMSALGNERWMDLGTLVELASERVLFERGGQVQIFYGQSWALTHMLLFSPRYSSRFSQLIAEVDGRDLPASTLSDIYGRSLGEIAADLRSYVSGGQLRPAAMELPPDIPADLQLTTVDGGSR